MEIKAHLVTKHAFGSCAGSVRFVYAVGIGVPKQVFVLLTDGVIACGLIRVGGMGHCKWGQGEAVPMSLSQPRGTTCGLD